LSRRHVMRGQESARLPIATLPRCHALHLPCPSEILQGHDLVRKPVLPFRHHALVPRTQSSHDNRREPVCDFRVQKGHSNHMFASVPLIPKFALERAARYSELRNRDTRMQLNHASLRPTPTRLRSPP
jgi:hypothetical protein